MMHRQILYILFVLLLQLPAVSQETKKESPGVFLNGSVGGLTLNTEGLLASIGAGLRWPQMHARMEFETIREDYVGGITQHKLFAAHLYNTHLLFGLNKSLGKWEGAVEVGPFFGWGTPGSTFEEDYDFTGCSNCGGSISLYMYETTYEESLILGGSLNLLVKVKVLQSWDLITVLGTRYYQFKWQGYKSHPVEQSNAEWRVVAKVGFIKKLD